MPTEVANATTPSPAPTMSSDTNFAPSTVDRCGSARNVGVRVLCRNSPVTARAPSSTGNTYPTDEAKL